MGEFADYQPLDTGLQSTEDIRHANMFAMVVAPLSLAFTVTIVCCAFIGYCLDWLSKIIF